MMDYQADSIPFLAFLTAIVDIVTFLVWPGIGLPLKWRARITNIGIFHGSRHSGMDLGRFVKS